MLVTIAARPAVEWLLKDLVGRPRPTGARLVAGTGFSYPSGHVLAAAVTWGFVPVIAALYIHRRWLWWALTGVAWSAIALVTTAGDMFHGRPFVVGRRPRPRLGLPGADRRRDNGHQPTAAIAPAPPRRPPPGPPLWAASLRPAWLGRPPWGPP